MGTWDTSYYTTENIICKLTALSSYTFINNQIKILKIQIGQWKKENINIHVKWYHGLLENIIFWQNSPKKN